VGAVEAAVAVKYHWKVQYEHGTKMALMK